ncbi:hypothetical protein LTR56_013826 [Elasticomyces elasticus]|nr:hypothetical protein LTR56_013826 [Elasticomyces elasticus]KAK3660569.1 hypothetical protein LTR22_008010 [Elasticomyces elasticus]KAK4923817.1 hypothetical protein LTR49_008965 [Elasticomyces elasticus]KAK5752000.1 hypothetical protein LTS12_017933 [Elasticomyces elasticus]
MHANAAMMASTTQPTLDKVAENSNTLITTTPSEKKKTTRTVRCLRIVIRPKVVRPDAATAKRCFDITEICEMILEHMAPIDILRAKRVCRKINAVLSRPSIALQNKLFLHGITTDPSNVWAFDGQTLFAGVHAQEAIRDANPTAVPPLTTMQPYLCNPLICHKLTKADLYAPSVNPGPWSAANAMGKKWDRDCTIKLNRNIDINKVPLEAPCRAMFISQPPTKEVYIELYGRVRYPEWEDRRGLNKWHWASVKELMVRNEAGVRFGEIVDAVREGLKGTWRGEFHHMRFVGGIPVSVEERAFVETAGEVTWRSDKFAEQAWTPK